MLDLIRNTEDSLSHDTAQINFMNRNANSNIHEAVDIIKNCVVGIFLGITTLLNGKDHIEPLQ